MMLSVNQLKVQRERERERERKREREREKGRTERDFCSIDLHLIDKLENASRQSEKNEELILNGKHARKILAKICKYMLLFIDQRTSYLIFPSFIWPFEKRALLCYGLNGVRC